MVTSDIDMPTNRTDELLAAVTIRSLRRTRPRLSLE